jgi:hypothetical protein
MTRAIRALQQMSIKRIVSIKQDRKINLNRIINQETLIIYTRETIAKKKCKICEKKSEIMTFCITILNLMKESYYNYHYNLKRKRCSFREIIDS